MARLRVAVITDIHYGYDGGTKLGSKAVRVVEAFARAMDRYKPDLIIKLGDDTDCPNHEDSLKHQQKISELFNAMAAPVHSAVGNHDLKFFSRHEFASLNGSSGDCYSFDTGDHHLVIFNPGGEHDTKPTDENIVWLQRDLAHNILPVVFFSHIPLDLNPADFRDKNEDIRGRMHSKKSPAIRKALEDDGSIVAAIAGHRHRDKHETLNGIDYFQLQSATHMWREKYRVPSYAWGLLDIEDGIGTFTFHGRGHERPKIYSLPTV